MTAVVDYCKGKYTHRQKRQLTANVSSETQKKDPIPCTLSGRFKLALIHRYTDLFSFCSVQFSKVTKKNSMPEFLCSYSSCTYATHTPYQEMNCIRRKYIGNQFNIQNDNLVYSIHPIVHFEISFAVIMAASIENERVVFDWNKNMIENRIQQDIRQDYHVNGVLLLPLISERFVKIIA